MQYVYIVRCSDGTLYTGYTTNVKKRLLSHNSEAAGTLGSGAKYTRSRRPVLLAYGESHDSKSAALKREYEIKRLTRQQKELLVQSLSVRGLREWLRSTNEQAH